MADGRLDLSSERPKRSLWQRIADVALMDVNTIVQGGIEEETVEALERVLLEADFGVDVTMELVDALERAAERGRVSDEDDLRALLGNRIREILGTAAESPSGPGPVPGAIPSGDAAPGAPGEVEGAGDAGVAGWLSRLAGRGDGGDGARRDDTAAADPRRELRTAEEGPTVVLILGVNGTGKTTTAAKLAHRLRSAGERVLLAATDTFRAGAQDQLRQWADRVGAGFVGGQQGGDPAAVAYDALEAARARDADWVLLDTAGRLHTQGDLMEELRKIDRVVARRAEGAPHERLLVVDATSGQNVLSQARQFGRALELTGLVLAKFDSSGRAGTVVAVARELGIPVRYLGTGEDLEDLEPFDADLYVEKLLGV